MQRILTPVHRRVDWPDWFCPVAPMPDELAHGYQNRVATLNCESGFRKLMGRLGDEGVGDPQNRRVVVLASIANMDVPDFVQHHTLTPLTRAFSSAGECYAHGTDHDDHLSRDTMYMPLLSRARYCGQCVTEDLQFWHFAYWRRSHQIPGIEWCLKHDCALTQGPGNVANGYSREFKAGNDREAVDLHPLRNSPVVARYIELVLAVLERRRPVAFSAVHQALRRQARSQGMTASDSGRERFLSSFALQECPPTWVASILPQRDCNETRQFRNALDGVCIDGTLKNPFAYLLVAALVYSDAMQVLREISDAGFDWQREPEGTNAPPNAVALRSS